MVEDNTQKFGDQTIGIHGQDLPFFSKTDESKTYWKYHPQAHPDVQSQRLLKQNNKTWAKNDDMYLGDVTEVGGPKDPFKTGRV